MISYRICHKLYIGYKISCQIDILIFFVCNIKNNVPSGIPVATVALNGAKNAAWLAAEILALSDDALAEKLEAERVAMAQQIAAKEEKLQNELNEL